MRHVAQRPGAAARAGRRADDETLLAAAIAQPILIERPIVETDKGAVIGRTSKRVLEVL
ncbi:MAG: ArsC/Spx/MgsR family protein [Brevundimonas sp.]|uniref:ArsC/Spx/MgsR family protein n=1 Tax=Brevundimonas sp. TaxID=1871086 RepID=UPI003919D919